MKLVRLYGDVDGLKTGFTNKAGYCLTATAKKKDMRLISVVMGLDSSDNRTSDTVKLLNYGFNSYKINKIYEKGKVVENVSISKGKKEYVNIILMDDATELEEASQKEKSYSINLKLRKIEAPVKKGTVVGIAEILDNEGKVIDKVDVTVEQDIKKASILDYFKRNLRTSFTGKY